MVVILFVETKNLSKIYTCEHWVIRRSPTTEVSAVLKNVIIITFHRKVKDISSDLPRICYIWDTELSKLVHSKVDIRLFPLKCYQTISVYQIVDKRDLQAVHSVFTLTRWAAISLFSTALSHQRESGRGSWFRIPAPFSRESSIPHNFFPNPVFLSKRNTLKSLITTKDNKCKV